MFDVPTAITLNTISHLACALIMGLVWWKNPDLPGVREWAAGRALIVVSFFYFILRSGSAAPVSVLISNALLLTGIYFIWMGNRRVMGRISHRSHPYFLVFLMVVLSALFYFTAQVPDYSKRAVIISLCTLAYALSSIHTFWPRTQKDRYAMANMLIAAHILMAFVHLFRAAGHLTGVGTDNYITSSPEAKLTLAGGIFVTILTTAAGLALLVEFLQKQLMDATRTDPLTGAYNRRAFFSMADTIYANSPQKASPISVLYLDLDYFKRVNDAYGHQVGDLVLKNFVALIQKTLRSSDVLARFGGEEFVIILPETGIKDASAIGERIRKTLMAQQLTPDLAIGEVTCSIGVAAADTLPHQASIETLIEQSDKALYQSKVNGRNQVSQYPV